MISGDKKNPKSTTSNTFPDEVIINFNVFGSSMEKRMNRKVSRTHIVTKERYRQRDRDMEITKNGANPALGVLVRNET